MPRLLLAALAVAALGFASRLNAAGPDFGRDIRPLLAAECLGCHGPAKQRGGLRLDRRADAHKGGDSGEPAPAALLARVTAADPGVRMPPKKPLSAGQIALLRQWVEAGAPWPEDGVPAGPAPKREMVVTDADRDHWAFRPLRPVEPPAVRDPGRARNPVDRFTLAKLDAAGVTPPPEADRRTLIRRLTFDLHGLPPTPEDVDAFAADPALDAYERLVDRLLAGPRYGERWGRHWLDVARYADSAGYERDPDRPAAWPYRDWVIRAHNTDLPYDVFLRWQLAGDELAPADPDARTATGFLAAGPLATADTPLEEEQRRYRADELDDIVGTVGTAALGLTVGCARCHDHKFDPIPTRDYYRLAAAFAGTKRAEEKLAGAATLVVRDTGPDPGPAWLLARGDVMSRAEVVPPGMLTVMLRGTTAEDYFRSARTGLGDKPVSTGRRAAVAAWLTDPKYGAGPLAARVAVNRAWQHHFGDGLCRTPGDFGTQADPPTHPELLDYLADQFVRDGWSLKRLHRLIVTSATYRQAIGGSRRPRRLEAEALRDAMLAVTGVLNEQRGGPGVKPPVPAAALGGAYNVINPWPKDARDDAGTRRRSVYVFTKRSLRPPLAEAFDGADPGTSCPRRSTTTVAPQALLLLNDPLVRAWAGAFAGRLAAEPDDPAAARRAFRLALGRDPADAELAAAVGFLRGRASAGRERAAALTDFAQAVFGLNEFLYVD